MKLFSLKSELRQGLFLFSFNIVLKAIREDQGRGIKTGKRKAKLSFFVNIMILYLKDPSVYMRNFLELTNTSHEV